VDKGISFLLLQALCLHGSLRFKEKVEDLRRAYLQGWQLDVAWTH
jgi:hypothetical protein